MLWAHQGPQSMLVSTVGVWHLTLCRASFWTMQSASKEFNCQDKQSVGWNHTAKKHHSQWDKCWTGLPSGGKARRLRYHTWLSQHFFDINNNKLIIISERGQMLLTDRNKLTATETTTQSQVTVMEVIELCCPWGMFQRHSNACQCSLLLPWNICERETTEQKKTV